jgi:branched-chain amino acid transport system permease protein
VSDTAIATATAERSPVETPPSSITPPPRPSKLRPVLLAALLLALLAAPFFLEAFWLRAGFAVFGAVVGAIGLNLLVGTTGQLSLAHAFFLAVGAVTYVYVSGSPGGVATEVDGLGLPPLLGMVLGVLFAGIAGLIFSPIAARLRGIYLGVASLGLVFIGHHILNTWTSVTGGFNGRLTPDFSLFGFSFSNTPALSVLGVPFKEPERLWYLGLVCAIGAYWFAKNLLRSRTGRALQTLRDSEVAASVMGVNVQGYKARVFLVSSMYAGLSGVLLALSIGSIAPESFDLLLSVNFLAMIVLGGLGSVGGAALGALFVAAVPLIFQRYADSIPFVSEVGQGGVAAGEGARFLFGLAIILVILFEPGGLVGLARRFKRKPTSEPGGAVTSRDSAATSSSTSSVPSDRPAQGSSS